jgi:hypothetical protein
LCFPPGATILRVLTCGEACSFDLALKLQAQDPLLWIIDSAPFWLGLFARWGGIRQDRVDFYARHLEQLVNQRTRELKVATREIADIMSNVPIALFSTNRDCTINPGCSAFAEELFARGG